MKTKITEIVKGMRSLACAIVALVATSAALPLMADGLAITPAEIPAATQQVHYVQTFTASGASGGLSWSTVAWKVESAASTYAVGANDTPLWDGAQTFYTNIVYTLPFAFPYRDQSFTNLYIRADGILFFTRGLNEYYSSVGNFDYLYNALVPFWMEEAENVEGYVDTSVAGEVSFRFEASYTNSSEVACKFAYRVTLKSDGTIRYSYRQDAGDTIGDSRRAVGLSYYDAVNYNHFSLPVGEESDGIPTCDYVFTTYTGYPNGFTFQGNYDYSSELYYPTATLSGQTSEFGTWTLGVSVYDAGTSTATTNSYTLTVAENPDKPPVFDAFTPADTNTARALAIGDTLNFHVEASDPKGGPFDITWTFLDADVESPVKRTLGTGADLTFVASNELYEIQRWGGSSVVKCTISDTYWTNSITWRVYISKEFYLDPAADPGAADGSAAHPWATIPEPAFSLRKGDTLNLVPGVYVIDDDSLGFPGGVTIRTTGSSADTKIVYPDGDGFFQGQNDHLKIANITVEGIRFQNADLEDCTIIGVQSPSYCFDDCSFTRCYVTGNSTTKEYLFRDSTLEDCTVAGNTIGYSASDDYFTGYTAIGPECQLVRSIVVNNLTLDGDEANWVDQEYWGIAATNCCTIPAMTDYGPGNIEAQPTFVSLEGYDARLRVGSACIADNPANNIGAYKGPGVEGFAVLATTDPVRGTVAFSGDVDFKSAHATHIVASGGSVTVTATAVTNRVFKNWIVNGEEGATTPTLTLNDITADMEVEAVFEVKEFYVNPTEADDSGDGSAAAPKKTAAAAAALALDGETIRLAEGSYEPFALLESSKVTLLGAGPDKTFIDGGGTNWCVRLGSNATLKNVAVVNGSHPQSSWYNYAGGVTGGTIENCVVSNCVSTRSAGGVANATVVSCLITDNSNTNEWSGYAGGLYHCKVYNSTIVGNIRLNSNVSGAESCYLFNNIITGNKSNGGSDTYDVYESRDRNLSSDVSSNVVYSTNLIGVDPWFVDAANGDYRLIAGSPAIDAGEDVPEFDFAHMTDLAGDRRIRGTAVDYGCYEGGIVTGAPAAPVATGASAKAAKGIPFTWESVPNAAEYRIYRGTVNDAASATQVGTTTATNYLDLATTGGTDYFYWISAWNSQFGESEKCGPIAVTAYADLKIETASLPAATEAVPYSVQLECSGNVGAATWSLPYTVVTREASTFDGSVGVVIGDDWPELSDSWQDNPVITLPFSFTWFGVAYDKVTISKFGGLYFGRNDNYLSWSSYGIDEYPKIAVNEGPYTSYYYVETTEWRVDSQSDYVTIVWKGTCDGKTVEFSATLNSDNTVRLAYGSNEVGAYVAFSNGSADTVTTVQPRLREDCSNMDDIVITCLPNESGLEISEDGLLTGIIDYAGSYTVSALVTDTDNGDVAYKTFTLTVNANANARPVIDSTSPATGGSQSPDTITKVMVPEGDSQLFTVAAHDPEGAALDYKWYLDEALVASGTNYTFTATSLSSHTLVCEVADALWTNGQVYAEWEIAVGKKFYVDAVNGTTNGTGTAGSPFKTIMAALDEAISYEASAILVAPGTYGQSYLSGGWYSGGPTIVVRSTGSAADTFIDGEGKYPCVANYCYHDGLTFEGFTLRNGHADYDWTPSRGGGGSFMVNLKNCVVYNCTAESAGGGVFGATIDQCTVYGCSAGTGGGIDATSTAINSIVWGNTATNAAAGRAAPHNYEVGAQFENCCTTPLPDGVGNIAEDPQFVDAAGGDFRLVDTSPCLASGMGCFATGGGVPVSVTYTVTFDANGGTCAEATRTVAKGKAVGALPQATRAGYTLDGWYTAKSGGTKVTSSTTITKDITFYARWTAIPTYTVTFDANGGTCATKTLKVVQGAAIGELPEATRDGYTLDGWFTAKTGGAQFTATDTVTKNITLYARWSEFYELTIDANGVLSGLTGTAPAALDVPATVTAFAADLFKGVTKITSATGGANVTKCGAGAFRDSGIWKAAPNGPVVVCGVLVGYKGTVPATLDVPSGVRVIADGALAGVTTLTTVYLPESLVSIGDGAFKNCAKLDDVIGLESGVTVAANAFEGTLHANFRLTYDSSGTTVTGFKGPLPAALVLPAKVIGVGVGVFKDQAALTSLVIEGTNTVNLGSSAFEGCANLATVTIGGSPTIAATTFKDCTALQTLTAGGSATIAASAFQTCTALKTFTAGGGATVGASAFEGCTTLETFTAGDTVSIVTNAFKGCVALANTDFGEVSELGAGAFEGCSLLASLELAEGIEEIGEAAFKDCTSLGQIDLPASVTTIGASAFEGCTNLVTITGGDNVRILRTDAFAGTPWYDSVPAGAFEEVALGHVLLRVKGDVPASYEISSNVWTVANNAFAGVTTLTDLYIGTEVVSLWDRAFAGCTSLGSVTVPSGCREFGDYLFDGCTSLTNVFFRGHAPTNDVPHLFAGTPTTLKVRIKEGSRGWEYPGADSDYRPARWPYQTADGRRWQRVSDDLNRAVCEPDEIPGVIRSVIVDGIITNDTTWVGGRVYEIQRNCSVKGNATLTVEAGAIVKLPFGRVYAYDPRGLNVYDSGSLVINGTLANPVVFTSIRDDSWGGDTNGDGNRSEPYPSECGGVCVVSRDATVHATYAKFLYGQAVNTFSATACLMSYGRTSTLYGCEFSHSAMDGYFGGGRLENCVFTDCDRGLVSVDRGVVAVNCVAYGNRIGFFSHTSYMYITNCISAFNSEYGISGDGNAVFSTRSCLWTPGGENTRYKNGGKSWNTYNVDNIEADPLFLDAENGDFRISVESPCVDAAYGEVAPMNDFYEQPRMDVKYVRNTGSPNAAGEYPDIGIYEVPGTTERPVMNLEVESVAFAPASAAPGETLTVTYTVRNTGTTAAKGSIRDVVRIKSAANGGTMTVGTVTQNYNLEAGGSAALVAAVTMPAAPAGEWLVGIDVNPNRDVFEQNFLKNSMWTEDAVEVRLQEMAAGSVWSANVSAGTTMGYVLAGLPEEGGVVVISGGASGGRALPVVARIATGHMPTAVMNDATSFVRADGAVVVVVPPHAAGDPVYLALENTGVSAERVNVSVQKLATELWSVYPEIAANVGDMGFTFTGAGLTAESDFRLGSIRAKSASVIDSANVYVVFDVQNVAADKYYNVTADGKVLRDAVYINKVAKGPILEAKLELPDRTRDNRVYTGYVVYENKGDTQMNVPMFVVKRGEGDTTTLLGAYDAETLTSNAVVVAGIGSSHPAGILKPGDTGRLPFKFKPVGDYNLSLRKWVKTKDDVAAMATRLNLRGRTVWDGDDIYYSALNVRNGNPVAGVSGWLLDARTREPLAETELYIVPTNNTARIAGSATTDASGYFQFPLLLDDAYAFIAADNSRVVSTGVVAVVKGQADVNGVEVLALPPARVHGYVMGSDGTPIQYGNVALRLDGMFSGATVETDGFGAYTFTGVMDGEYEVHALAFERYEEALSEKFTISMTNLDVRADVVMRSLACVHGTVSCDGVPVTNGVVEVFTSEAEMTAVSIDTNGTWRADGIAPGKCTFTLSARGYALKEAATLDVQPGDGNRLDLEAIDGPLFGVGHRVAYVEEGVPFNERLYVLNPSTNDVSYTWNFGDGSPEVTTTSVHTYHEYVRTAGTNSFDVTLTIKMADGTTDYRTLLEVVNLLPPVETIYKDNAIILSEERRVNAGTLEFVGFDPDGAEEGTVMVLKGEADIPLDGAAVMVGYVTKKGVVSDIRRVISHETRPDGTVWCTTSGDAGFLDIFEQIAETISQDVVIPAEQPADERLYANNKVGSALAKFLNGAGHAVAAGAKKTGAHFMNGGKLIGEMGTSLGCEMGPNCLTGHIDTEISTVVRRYICEEGYWTNYGHKTQRWHPAYDNTYTNTVCAYTIVTHLDFKPYLQVEGSSGIGFEKRTDKCELWTPEAGWSIKIHGVPIDDIKPTLQFRPYLAVGASGGLKLFLRVWGDLIFNLELENTIHEKPVRISCNYDGIKTESGVEQLEERDFIGSVEGGVGVLFGMKGRVAKFIDVLTGVELAAQLKVWRGQTKAEPVSAEARIAANYVLEATLKDFNVFNRIMDRISFIKFSGAIANLVNWRWRAAKSDFDWEQESGSKEKGYVVKFEDWSIPSYKAHMSGGWGEGLSRALNLWSWWKGFKWEVSRKRWIINEDPIDSVGWCFGDRTYTYTNNMEYVKTRYYDFGKPGKYNVWMKIYSGPLWFFGYCCNKTVEVKEMEEEKEEEKEGERKSEAVDEQGARTQKSVDPNEMAGPEGVGEERFVKPGQRLTYTIYFENMAAADIAAQEVRVDNSLSEYLDWNTFEMGTVSVGGRIDGGLDGATAADIVAATSAGLPLASEMDQTNGLYKTRTEVQLDAATGVASWYIRVLDPAKRKANDGECWPDDPDAGVLQPNRLPPEGEGYITYSVCVSSNAPAFAVINNSADIVFDDNAVIVTDPAWWNTVYGGGAEFIEPEIEVDEGSNAVVHVVGGNADKASSVKMYITYNTAASADLNLGKTKYPVTIKWAKGEIGEKAVTIPIKADALVEGEEMFTLQLAAPNGMTLGDVRNCTVYINDAQWPKGMSDEEAVARGLAAVPAGATATTNAAGLVTGYFTKKNKKGNVTAKAMPGYVFVGWVYTKNGKTYSTKATITDKERKTKKVQPKFVVAHYLRALADPTNGGKVTGSGLYAEKKSVTIKATPNKNWTFGGWYNADGSFASKAKSLKVSVTNELTYLAAFKPYPKVTVEVDNAKGGTVKGAGSYLAGKTVTLKATPKKGYAFCGWFDADGNLVTLNASYKYKVTADGLALSASFKKESALTKPVLTWDATNLTVGVSYSAKPTVVGESLVSVTKVTGLPKGLTFKSGKVTGVPTVAKVVTAKVTVALKSNAKKKWTYSVKLNVAALPTWAVGTFKGTLYDGEGESAASKGTVTLTVGKTGKISGKFVDTKKKSYSFSATSFKTFEDGVLRSKATMKYGKKSVTVEIKVGQDGETSVGSAEVGSTAAPFSGHPAVLAK